MAIHMRKVLGGAQRLAPSGGLPGRRSSPQQTTDFHRTMAKVCKRVVKGPSPKGTATARLRRFRPFAGP
jgi:hypothetical protein